MRTHLGISVAHAGHRAWILSGTRKTNSGARPDARAVPRVQEPFQWARSSPPEPHSPADRPSRCRSGVGAHAAQHRVPLAPLEQGRLALQDLEGLLQTCEFGLEPRLALPEGLGPSYALLLERLQVLEDRVQFRLSAGAVRGGLCHGLVQACCLHSLVLSILFLGRLLDLVLLGLLVIGCLRSVLRGRHLNQPLREIGLNHLEEADDSAPGSLGRLMRLGGILRVVLAQQLQRQLHALETTLHVRLPLGVIGLLLLAQLIHLGLRFGKLGECLLQGCNLRLQLRGA
mmetsp:Transcript_23547/g.65183  ORF Transcript_23547/g.65183 Transcript_23547/m.65183 type:complete len:286 (-) Transcript_23547:452-1309(-)